MTMTQTSQSVDEFGKSAAETLDRLDATGEAEVLTIDGKPRAVLLSPAVYQRLAEEVLLSRDVENMRQSIEEFNQGKGRDAMEAMDEIRAKLLAMKVNESGGAVR